MLALVAGTGELPNVVHRRLIADGEPTLVCALDGFQPSIPVEVTFRLEHLGSFLRDLVGKGVKRLCMAGAVKRPTIDPSVIDKETAPLVPRLQAAMGLGDDGTLRELIAIIEEFDLIVVGASDLVPELLPKTGVPTACKPTSEHRLDATVGDGELRRMGDADSGQACIVKGGSVIANEGPDGTDAMLRRFAASENVDFGFAPFDLADSVLGSASDWLSGQVGMANGGVLFKGPKPNQDRRADLPVIGLETVLNAKQAGLDGIIIEQGGVMVLDLDDVIAVADEAGMFLWIRE